MRCVICGLAFKRRGRFLEHATTFHGVNRATLERALGQTRAAVSLVGTVSGRTMVLVQPNLLL